MEQLISLYRILISVSAAALLLGLILISGRFGQLKTSQKQLYLLAGFNLVSMVVFLFGFRELYQTKWKELILFIETLVLVLNLICAYFIEQAVNNREVSFANQIKQLFLVSFLSICTYFSVYYIMGGNGSLLNKDNEAFPWIYGISLLLFIAGSVYPTLLATKHLLNKTVKEERYVSLLVAVNGLNNLIGLVFFILEFPNKSSSVVLNIVSNLVFGYLLAYYFLSRYFIAKPETKLEEVKPTKDEEFSWASLSQHLSYWNDTRTYLLKVYPDLVTEIDALPLSDLEKIHLALKNLNIKTKDIAIAMAVSVRAVEMQRYRIKKKLSGETEEVEE